MYRTRAACPTVVELGCGLLGVLVSCIAFAANAVATASAPPATDEAAVLARIRDTAMSSDWRGRERPGEYVIASGHLDSWDLATGAMDDGVGVISAAAVIEILRQQNLHPRRTIRFIGWANEENGGRGSKAYFASVGGAIDTQTAAIESDDGAGRSLGVDAAANHLEPAEFMNAGTGRAAARRQFAMALTTEPTAGRFVMRSRHSRSFGVAAVTGAL